MTLLSAPPPPLQGDLGVRRLLPATLFAFAGVMFRGERRRVLYLRVCVGWGGVGGWVKPGLPIQVPKSTWNLDA